MEPRIRPGAGAVRDRWRNGRERRRSPRSGSRSGRTTTGRTGLGDRRGGQPGHRRIGGIAESGGDRVQKGVDLGLVIPAATESRCGEGGADDLLRGEPGARPCDGRPRGDRTAREPGELNGAQLEERVHLTLVIAAHADRRTGEGARSDRRGRQPAQRGVRRIREFRFERVQELVDVILPVAAASHRRLREGGGADVVGGELGVVGHGSIVADRERPFTRPGRSSGRVAKIPLRASQTAFATRPTRFRRSASKKILDQNLLRVSELR